MFFFAAVMMAVVPATRAAPDTFPAVKDLPVRQEMPDAMTMDDGTPVTMLAQWRMRRAEIKAVLEHYELGQAPPPPGNVSGRDLKTNLLLNGTVNYRLVHLKFGPEGNPGFDIAIFTPAKSAGPFPTIINPSFFNTPGVAVTNPMPMPPAAATNLQARLRFYFNAPVTPERGAEDFSNQLARGYAMVTYHYTECGADNANFRDSSFYPAYPGYDWGVLLGWAWGLSRVVDYLETQPFVDTNQAHRAGPFAARQTGDGGDGL